MFDKFETPRELFAYKLGSALKMEDVVLETLGKLEERAQSEELKGQFRHHAAETRQQIANLKQVFATLDERPDEKPCPVMHAISLEAAVNIKRTKPELVDSVILAAAAETEHHEIAVYEWLMCEAEAMENQEAVRLLQENLEQEQHTLNEIRQATRTITRDSTAKAA